MITVKTDQTMKLALHSIVLNKSIHKNKYQMPKFDTLIDSLLRIFTEYEKPSDKHFFHIIDLIYIYCQLNRHTDIAKPCNFNIVN